MGRFLLQSPQMLIISIIRGIINASAHPITTTITTENFSNTINILNTSNHSQYTHHIVRFKRFASRLLSNAWKTGTIDFHLSCVFSTYAKML